MTHVELARRPQLSERTVRDRIAWAGQHGWLRVDGPRTRRVYIATVPHDVRRDMPDTSADIVPMRPRRRCASCGRTLPKSTSVHHAVCRTCWVSDHPRL